MMENQTLEEALKLANLRKRVTEKLKKVLIERLMLNLEPNEITEDTALFGGGLGLDSVDSLEVAVALEQHFGASITDEDMSSFRSINSLVDFILENCTDESLLAEEQE